jgi:hypothetical protein
MKKPVRRDQNVNPAVLAWDGRYAILRGRKTKRPLTPIQRTVIQAIPGEPECSHRAQMIEDTGHPDFADHIYRPIESDEGWTTVIHMAEGPWGCYSIFERGFRAPHSR